MTRRNLFAAFFLLVVTALTLWAALRGSNMHAQYGLARIRLDGQTIFVKSRICSAGCAQTVWLSRNSNRCKAPDLVADYSFNASQLLYATTGNKLLVLGTRYAIVLPSGGDWIDIRFVPPNTREAENTPFHSIMFGEHLPIRDVPTEQVELEPCIRAFGRDW